MSTKSSGFGDQSHLPQPLQRKGRAYGPGVRTIIGVEHSGSVIGGNGDGSGNGFGNGNANATGNRNGSTPRLRPPPILSLVCHKTTHISLCNSPVFFLSPSRCNSNFVYLSHFDHWNRHTGTYISSPYSKSGDISFASCIDVETLEAEEKEQPSGYIPCMLMIIICFLRHLQGLD